MVITYVLTPPVVISFTYDKLYRLASVSQPPVVSGPPSVIRYGHDEVGNRTRLTYPDNKQVSYIYDDINRLDVVTTTWLASLSLPLPLY